MKNWAWSLLGVGWYVAICIVLGVGVGVWLDRKLGTSPYLALLGTLFGSFLAFYGMYKMLLPGLQQKNNHKKPGEGD